MEEIRNVANAYYARLSPEGVREAENTFKKMDKDGNGNVSIDEFLEHFKEADKKVFYHGFFADLDANGDGMLEYNEFITLYYLYISGRLLFCCSCNRFLKSTYFSCIDCYNCGSDTHDVCVDCFCKEEITCNHGHDKSRFMDNFTLLLKKKPSPPAGAPSQANAPANGRKGKMKKALKKLFQGFVCGTSTVASIGEWMEWEG